MGNGDVGVGGALPRGKGGGMSTGTALLAAHRQVSGFLAVGVKRPAHEMTVRRQAGVSQEQVVGCKGAPEPCAGRRALSVAAVRSAHSTYGTWLLGHAGQHEHTQHGMDMQNSTSTCNMARTHRTARAHAA